MTIITTSGIVNSSTITPQAGDDLFTSTGITEDSGTTVLNVMANDLGGKAKTLYSLDDGIENEGSSSSADLLTRDFVGGSNLSKSGALIKITADGMVSYTMTATCKANFQSLALGEIGTDSFTYAIRLANGTLSTATATVQIMGTNDAPVAMADVSSAFEDTIINGTVAANDTDIDNGAVLTYSLNAPVDGLTINSDGSYSFDAGNAAYQSLGEGVMLDVVANYTVTDEFGATSVSTLTITLTGTNDVPTIGGVSTGDVTEDATTPDLSASGELTISDVDTGESSFVAQVSTAGSNGYGTFAVNAGGTWTYSALNSQIAIQSLAAGATLTDSFTVTSFDGSNSLSLIHI
jgi:VCBS repeat-containing protein